MTNPHLSPGELLAASSQLQPGASPVDPAAIAHLSGCPQCQAEVAALQSAQNLLAPLRTLSSASGVARHPAPQALANFTAGLPDEAILAHLALCARCAAIVAPAASGNIAGPDENFLIPATTPEWRDAMAQTFRAEATRAANANQRATLIRWVAAAVVVLAAASFTLSRLFFPDPAALLAQAYTENRPFAFRLADAGFSELHLPKGASPVPTSDALFEARRAIRKALAGKPSDPALLALSGRESLLERDFAQAITTLSLASQALPNDPSVLADLGVACAARGQASAEARTSDLALGMEYLLRARRLPGSPDLTARILFNLALIQEELALKDEAAATWREFLPLSTGGWRAEAQRHLDAVLNDIERKRKADAGVTREPAEFLAARARNPDLDPLPYFDAFWTLWLPSARLDPNPDGPATTAARTLARDFATHGENSLLDTISALHRDRSGALALLAQAMLDNRGKAPDEAPSLAESAARDLAAEGLTSAAFLAKIELAYASRRSAHLATCLSALEQPLRLPPLKYRWITAVAHLEHVACMENLGHADAARAEASATFDTLSREGPWPVFLRSAVFLASLDSDIGNYLPVWDRAPAQMRQYWATTATHYRLQGFFVYLSEAAAAAGWNETALLLSRGAIREAGLAGDVEMQASSYGPEAALLSRLGRREEALHSLRLAEKLLAASSSAPSTGVRSELWWETQISIFAAEAETPGTTRTGELSKLLEAASGRPDYDRMRLLQASALSLFATGKRTDAYQQFQQATEINQRLSASLPWVQRLPSLDLVATSWKHLAQLQLLEDHNPAKALATLSSWHPRTSTGFGSLSITFADLPDGLHVLSSTPAGVTARRVAMPTPQIHAATDRFLALCARPDSDLRELDTLALQLYQWLLAPELNAAPPATVYVSAEPWLASLPLAALRDTSTTWLGERFSFINDTGPPATSPLPAVGRSLVVAAPFGAIPGGSPLPSLTDAVTEARFVASVLPGSVLLTNTSAQAISAAAPGTRIFHFTGHGWSNGGSGALILPPASDGSPRFLSARDIARQDWSRCRLAVLSACLTAGGADPAAPSRAVNNQSLVNAFLGAGARQVLASLWNVDSASTEALMETFYTRLNAGDSTQDALAAATRAVARNPRWSHPNYWAGFALFGAASPIPPLKEIS